MTQEEKKKKKKKQQLPTVPPWVSGVNWTEDVAMRYHLPANQLTKQLRDDKVALKKCKQHPTVMMQLQELLLQLDEQSEVSDVHYRPHIMPIYSCSL